SPSTQSGRCRGRPCSPCSGGMASTNARTSCESFRFAPVRRTASGTPRPSQIRWRLLPRLARAVGFGPVWSPPYTARMEQLVDDRPRPIDLIFAFEPIQQRKHDQVPDPGFLPVAHAPPAGHPRPTPEFLRKHLPGDAAAEDKQNGGETRAIRNARPSAFWPTWRSGKEGFDKIPQRIWKQR